MRLALSLFLFLGLFFTDIALFETGDDWFHYKPGFPGYAGFEVVADYLGVETYITDRERIGVIEQRGSSRDGSWYRTAFKYYSSNRDSLVVSNLCSDSLLRHMYFYEVKDEFGQARLTYKWLDEEEGRKFFERNGKNRFPYSGSNPVLQLIRIGCLIGILLVHKTDFIVLRMKFREWWNRRSERRRLMLKAWQGRQSSK